MNTEITFEIVESTPSQAASELSAPIEKTAALFEPFRASYIDAERLLAEVSSVTTPSDARALRLKLVKARTAIERVKKDAKADIVFAGRVIDYYNNKGVARIQAAESDLEEIEKAAERAEAARKAELKLKRETELRQFEVSTDFFDLANMPDEGYAQLVQSSRIAHASKIEADRKAEEERIAREKAEAEAREAARIQAEKDRVENERLKAEAAAREEAMRKEREESERKLAEERAKAESEAKRIADEARRDREAIEAKAKAEAEAARKQAEEERAKREAIEKAEREKIEAEKEAARKAAAAPDKDKLAAIAKEIKGVFLPVMETDQGKQSLVRIEAAIESLVSMIRAEYKKL